MKRSLLAIAVAVFFTVSSFAQEFEEGDKVLNLGIGFGSTLYSGSFYTSALPPISASFEVGVKDGVIDEGSIGVGGYVGFSRYKWESFGAGYNISNIIVGARGVFHYPLLDQLDSYAGILLGVRIVSSNVYNDYVGYYSPAGTRLVGSFYLGGRYYFTDNIAAMMELGYGISWVNLGVALKL